jgi:hypothetical protein
VNALGVEVKEQWSKNPFVHFFVCTFQRVTY